MKIGIISDTHDNLYMISKAIEVFQAEQVELVIHAGDHVAPFTVMMWDKMGIEIQAVFGNNDGDHELLKKAFRRVGAIHDRPREFIIRGKRLLVMHEPDNLKDLALSEKYDFIIYGHTHRKRVYREGKTLIINPGEGGGWLIGTATAMILDLETGDVREVELGKSPLEPLITA